MATLLQYSNLSKSVYRMEGNLEEEKFGNQAKYHCWQNKIWRIVSKAHVLFN